MRIFLLLLFLPLILMPLASHALCVNTYTANLRSGPGPKFPVTWTVPKYMPLIEIQKKGGWYEVEDMDGEHHWVYSSNATRKMVCVAVKVGTAKLRKTPGVQGELAEIRQVDRYTPFNRIDEQGEWYEVQASWGETYWIHESNVWRPIKIQKMNF